MSAAETPADSYTRRAVAAAHCWASSSVSVIPRGLNSAPAWPSTYAGGWRMSRARSAVVNRYAAAVWIGMSLSYRLAGSATHRDSLYSSLVSGVGRC